MSNRPLSKMDHVEKAEKDMQYLIQPRGAGTGFVFRMMTPPELVGQANPWTGKPFGKEIRKGLGTRHFGEARKLRDKALGDIRTLCFEQTDESRFSVNDALELKQQIASDPEGGLGMAVGEQLERAAERGVDPATLRRFGRIAFGKGYPVDRALEQYIEERAPGNRRGYKPITKTTALNLRSAVTHLRRFLKDKENLLCLENVTPKVAGQFREEYLPNLRTNRSPNGPSYKTVKKNVTLLEGLWRWAIDRRIPHYKYRNPWVHKRSTPTGGVADPDSGRQTFTPAEIGKLFAATTPGSAKGDVLRLALITGCRADEIAALDSKHVSKDGSGFLLLTGKTKAARRYIPIPIGAQALLRSRVEKHQHTGRLFPEWPIRPSVGKVYAVSQWFTRFRRKMLGGETDGSLALHSMRHTWRTVARQERVPEGDIHDIGGWSGPRTSSHIYDHGMTHQKHHDRRLHRQWRNLPPQLVCVGG